MPSVRTRRDSPAAGPAGSPRAGAHRDPAVDAYRGLAVLLMAAGNVEIGVRVFPDALKHTVDVGYTVADVVAPVFVVAMGLTVGPSMRRRRAVDGTWAAYRHLAIRGLALIGIGAVISAGQAVVRPLLGIDATWGALQALGGATLLLLPVVLGPRSCGPSPVRCSSSCTSGCSRTGGAQSFSARPTTGWPAPCRGPACSCSPPSGPSTTRREVSS